MFPGESNGLRHLAVMAGLGLLILGLSASCSMLTDFDQDYVPLDAAPRPPMPDAMVDEDDMGFRDLGVGGRRAACEQNCRNAVTCLRVHNLCATAQPDNNAGWLEGLCIRDCVALEGSISYLNATSCPGGDPMGFEPEPLCQKSTFCGELCEASRQCGPLMGTGDDCPTECVEAFSSDIGLCTGLASGLDFTCAELERCQRDLEMD